MRLGDLPDQGQADAAPSLGSHGPLLAAHEALEDAAAFFTRNPLALVAHGYAVLPPHPIESNRHPLAGRRVLQRVVDQIHRGNFQGPFVGGRQARSGRHLEDQLHALTFGATPTEFDGAPHRVGHVDLVELVGSLATFQPGEVENVVDQCTQTLTFADDDLEILALLLGIAAPSVEQLTEHAHQRQRGLEFVGDVRHELALEHGQLPLAIRRDDDDDEAADDDEAGQTHQHHLDDATAFHGRSQFFRAADADIDAPLVEGGGERTPQSEPAAAQGRSKDDAAFLVHDVEAALLPGIFVDDGEQIVDDARHVVPNEHQAAFAGHLALEMADQVALLVDGRVQVTQLFAIDSAERQLRPDPVEQ